MKTVLVVGEHPGSAEAVRAALNPAQVRVVHRTSVEGAEPLLAHGLVSLCVLDVNLSGVQGVWVIEKLRRRAPQCPVVVLTEARQSEWEEEALLHGVAQVISKPVRPRMLQVIVDRLLQTPVSASSPGVASSTEFLGLSSVKAGESVAAPSFPSPPVPNFELLRKFSGVLTYSLNAEGMIRQFLLLLREMFSVNRAVIFLRSPLTSPGVTAGLEDSRRLSAMCSLGMAPGLLEHFELSLDSGTGALMTRLGRILRRGGDEIARTPEAQKEFELLGVNVAVPILDREQLLGVALFDGRVTGEPLVNAELEVIFHLLEQLGLAIRNIWLHDQLASNHATMAEILRELSSACVVVGRELQILHANKAARRFFGGMERNSGEMEFSDLPQELGGKVYQVLQTGAAVASFKYEPDTPAKPIFYVSIVPFHGRAAGLPAAALLIAEDRTQAEQLQQLEIEAANLRLVKNMADRMAHEIGNALVPIAAHQQLLTEKYRDPEFRASLNEALADGVKRISRLISQMRFLARDAVLSPEAVPLAALVEEAYQEAQKFQPTHTSQLRYEDGGKPIVVNGDRAALRHALAEVMINALQANPENPKIGVRLQDESTGNGKPALQIEVQDNGTGFAPEVAQQAASPFFTMRNVGLGLGLAVTRKIIETHHGKLEIVPTPTAKTGMVRISLPLPATV
ncbi:MAG TPA: response regulator [Verrucomicrobiota bacterium]|jgi:signal transduction histidine kinase/CheY-like chemotaxis protein|nr:response regulator [Verrucomicrobiota bacterium]HQB17892.1 response regulator [Verrucomicrobiota bacterium]